MFLVLSGPFILGCRTCDTNNLYAYLFTRKIYAFTRTLLVSANNFHAKYSHQPYSETRDTFYYEFYGLGERSQIFSMREAMSGRSNIIHDGSNSKARLHIRVVFFKIIVLVLFNT